MTVGTFKLVWDANSFVKRHPRIKGIYFAVIIIFIRYTQKEKGYVHIFMVRMSAKLAEALRPRPVWTHLYR